MPDTRFACTLCGACCHDHNLPLTLTEAIGWLEEGGEVGVLCEAAAWAAQPPPDDRRAAYRLMRSFPASTGTCPLRVSVLLVAMIAGPCHHLSADLRCGIYERRPLSCRIYPAELNPFIELDPAGKSCPPEAWTQGPPLTAGGVVVDAETQALIERRHQADCEDAPRKELLCRLLGLEVTAVAEEGYAVYAPQREALLDALRAARDTGAGATATPTSWRLVTASVDTVARLHALGARFVDALRPDDPFQFVTVTGRAPGAG